MEDFIIRTASITDINLMLKWASKEGRNPGIHDVVPFHATDPAGFLMGYLDENPIASISIVRYANHFAFLGFYIVAERYRGFGYGLKLWQSGVTHLHGYNIGLDGVPDQQDMYEKSGFKLSHRHLRYSGFPLRSNVKSVVDTREIPFDKLIDYDKTFFPSRRQSFLACWLNMPNSHTYACIRHGDIIGYGVIRACHEGFKIGPLFADDAKTAEQLLYALCQHTDQGPVFIDVPEINVSATNLIEGLGYKHISSSVRMYTDVFPEINWHNIFGVTSTELG